MRIFGLIIKNADVLRIFGNELFSGQDRFLVIGKLADFDGNKTVVVNRLQLCDGISPEQSNSICYIFFCVVVFRQTFHSSFSSSLKVKYRPIFVI